MNSKIPKKPKKMGLAEKNGAWPHFYVPIFKIDQ
jgi:hypothetical protein